MSAELEKLREALAAAPPHVEAFTDEAIPISRALYDVVVQPCIAHVALLGYRSRDAEVAELQKQVRQYESCTSSNLEYEMNRSDKNAEQIAALQAEKAELVEALEAVMDEFNCHDGNPYCSLPIDDGVQATARALLAKHGKGAV